MLKQNVSLRQEQKLKLSPKLYQTVQMMALPLIDLQTKIHEEIEKNPALELVRESGEVSLSEYSDEKKERDYDPFENSSDPGYSSRSSSNDDSKRMFMEGALTREDTLQDHLLDQLHCQQISEREMEIGELVVANLDENGFHLENPTILVPEREYPVLDKVIAIVQSLDPVGCAAFDYIDSLVVQSRQRRDMPEGAEDFIRNHLRDYKENKLDSLMQKTGMDEEDMEGMILFIKTLNPFPGRLYSSVEPQYVIPDLMVQRLDGKFTLFLNDNQIPLLEISEEFQQLEGNEGTDKSAGRYIKSRIREAEWFIHSLQQRNATLLKAAKVILEKQYDFFEKGPKALKPLILKDVAEAIDVHETTVSRITSNKYIQTEWGIFELKYFFTNSISGSGTKGSTYSKEAVKEIIKEIIQEAEKRLSDQKISDILKNRGISIARRTVAKYRGELDIDSSYNRSLN